jgi:hypothetical protein
MSAPFFIEIARAASSETCSRPAGHSLRPAGRPNGRRCSS